MCIHKRVCLFTNACVCSQMRLCIHNPMCIITNECVFSKTGVCIHKRVCVFTNVWMYSQMRVCCLTLVLVLTQVSLRSQTHVCTYTGTFLVFTQVPTSHSDIVLLTRILACPCRIWNSVFNTGHSVVKIAFTIFKLVY